MGVIASAVGYKHVEGIPTDVIESGEVGDLEFQAP